MELTGSVDVMVLLFCSFLLGGVVKGVIGTGLPTIALALITASIGIREGMAIILLPSIVTNIRQGLLGGYFQEIVQRSWSFLLATFCAIWLGASLLKSVDLAWLTFLLGVILLVYSFFGLVTKTVICPIRHERWLNPVVGLVNGLLTGLTGSSVIPGVLYLQSLGIERDKFIQTMGLLFLVSTSTLALALQKNELLTRELLELSAFACIPSYLGMFVGERVRKYLSEQMFRRLFFIFMLLLGCYILVRSLF